MRYSVLCFHNNKQIDLLKDACTFHTTIPITDNLIIDTCFDAEFGFAKSRNHPKPKQKGE